MSVRRKVLFWCHLAAGVTAGIVILIMSVTGVALTYQKEMQYWADTRHFHLVPPAGVPRAPVTDLIATVQAASPEFVPATITWQADVASPVALTAGPRTLYVDPYTCDVLGEATGQRMRSFFITITNWHRYVAMSGESRATGKAITGASNLVFLFIVLSGIYLWWPKVRSAAQFRNITWFRGGLRAKAREFNWHNTFGFWCALPLAVVVASATVISYPWASNAAYRVMGEVPPAPSALGAAGSARVEGGAGRSVGVSVATLPTIDLDRHVAKAMTHQPGWQTLALRVPASDAAPVVFTIDRGDAGQPHLRGTLTLDRASADLLKWEDFSSQTPGRRLRTVLRFMHTGEIGGLAGQTMAGLASFAGAMLVYTGISLSLRRFAAWRRRA